MARAQIVFPTEFLHGLLRWRSGAGWRLWEWWWNNFHWQGFLWVFADEGVVRQIKMDEIDTFGRYAQDGIWGLTLKRRADFLP
jgi:hypothetical protein